MHFYFDALNSPLKILEFNKREKRVYMKTCLRMVSIQRLVVLKS